MSNIYKQFSENITLKIAVIVEDYCIDLTISSSVGTFKFDWSTVNWHTPLDWDKITDRQTTHDYCENLEG